MAIYKCRICGAVFDEEKENRSLSELECCPVCKQPVSSFERVDPIPDAAMTSQPKVPADAHPVSDLSYSPEFIRHDKNARFMEEI